MWFVCYLFCVFSVLRWLVVVLTSVWFGLSPSIGLCFFFVFLSNRLSLGVGRCCFLVLLLLGYFAAFSVVSGGVLLHV